MSTTVRHLHVSISLLGLALAMGASAADGVQVFTPSDLPTRWQLRLDLGASANSRLGPASRSSLTAPVRAALLGDFDLGSFGITLPQTIGRFRATSGLMFGWSQVGNPSAGLIWPRADAGSSATPYLGLGYTGWLAKSGLSFSADVGLTADYLGSGWGFGRALFGNQGNDQASREFRLQPRLQMGLQYRY
jgi:hypothetical protein